MAAAAARGVVPRRRRGLSGPIPTPTSWARPRCTTKTRVLRNARRFSRSSTQDLVVVERPREWRRMRWLWRRRTRRPRLRREPNWKKRTRRTRGSSPTPCREQAPSTCTMIASRTRKTTAAGARGTFSVAKSYGILKMIVYGCMIGLMRSIPIMFNMTVGGQEVLLEHGLVVELMTLTMIGSMRSIPIMFNMTVQGGQEVLLERGLVVEHMKLTMIGLMRLIPMMFNMTVQGGQEVLLEHGLVVELMELTMVFWKEPNPHPIIMITEQTTSREVPTTTMDFQKRPTLPITTPRTTEVFQEIHIRTMTRRTFIMLEKNLVSAMTNSRSQNEEGCSDTGVGKNSHRTLSLQNEQEFWSKKELPVIERRKARPDILSKLFSSSVRIHSSLGPQSRPSFGVKAFAPSGEHGNTAGSLSMVKGMPNLGSHSSESTSNSQYSKSRGQGSGLNIGGPTKNKLSSTSQATRPYTEFSNAVDQQRSVQRPFVLTPKESTQIFDQNIASTRKNQSYPQNTLISSTEDAETSPPPGSNNSLAPSVIIVQNDKTEAVSGSFPCGGDHALDVTGAKGLTLGTPAVLPVMKFSEQHPRGPDIPCTGMAFPGLLAHQPSDVSELSQITWLQTLSVLLGFLGQHMILLILAVIIPNHQYSQETIVRLKFLFC